MFVEEDDVLGINELISEIARHDASVQVFPAGSRVIAVRILLHAPLDLSEFSLEAESLKAESVYDLLVSFPDRVEFNSEILIFGSLGMHSVEKIRDFIISAESFSRR